MFNNNGCIKRVEYPIELNTIFQRHCKAFINLISLHLHQLITVGAATSIQNILVIQQRIIHYDAIKNLLKNPLHNVK